MITSVIGLTTVAIATPNNYNYFHAKILVDSVTIIDIKYNAYH